MDFNYMPIVRKALSAGVIAPKEVLAITVHHRAGCKNFRSTVAECDCLPEVVIDRPGPGGKVKTINLSDPGLYKDQGSNKERFPGQK